MTEQREWRSQEAYVAFLGKALPHDAFCIGVDEAAKRSRQANLRRKARGCHGGFADLMICWNRIWLFLECKEADGTQHANQKTFADGVQRAGANYVIVRCMEDVEHACIGAGIPLRATLGDIRARIAEQQERLPPKPKRAARKTTTPRYTMSKSVAKRAARRGILV